MLVLPVAGRIDAQGSAVAHPAPEGWVCNHKRVYRLYRQEQLAVRRRKRKKLAATARVVLPVPPRPNERSSMDFMSDTLATGRAFRTLNIVDDASRECLVIEVDHGLASLRVIRVLEQLAATRGLPRQIVVDNGPEFTSTALDAWAYTRRVELRFILISLWPLLGGTWVSHPVASSAPSP